MKLIVAEKPSVGRTIAAAVGANESIDGYLQGHGCIVTWCIGHLVELALPEDYKPEYAHWRYKDLPIIPGQWKYKVTPETAAQFNLVRSLMNDERVTEIICATDAGREGELIFRLVYEQAGCRKPVRRLWISSMETTAIEEGFRSMKSMTAYDNLYAAALCRAQADWLIGMNATRLYSLMYGPTLHIGRVMTPTLAMLAERESAIDHFEPETFYTVKLELGNGLTAQSERFHDPNDARSLMAACEQSSAVIKKIDHKQRIENPPALYDLTTLQRDSNRIFGYTAQQTLEYAQGLYEKRLLTYPAKTGAARFQCAGTYTLCHRPEAGQPCRTDDQRQESHGSSCHHSDGFHADTDECCKVDARICPGYSEPGLCQAALRHG